MPKTKNKTLRSYLATCVAKICAYRECGKEVEAIQWAEILKLYLIENGLLIDNRQRGGDNGQQSHNEHKKQTESTR